MAKKNKISFCIEDWNMDVHMLSIEAYGGWHKIILKMYAGDKTGIYRMSDNALQKLWKKDANEVLEIIKELQDENVCIIKIEEGFIEFGNRRMIRQHKKRIASPDPKEEEGYKKDIPTIEVFLQHCKESLMDKFASYEFSIRSKYKTWVDNGWKDGYDNPIKNWKNKINNGFQYLKPIHNVNGTAKGKHTALSNQDLFESIKKGNPGSFQQADNNG